MKLYDMIACFLAGLLIGHTLDDWLPIIMLTIVVGDLYGRLVIIPRERERRRRR